MRLDHVEREKILDIADGIKDKIESKIDRNMYRDIVLCGSVAKGTALSGSSDVDLFIRFERDVDQEAIPDIIRKLSRDLSDDYSIGDGGIKYGTYPYIEFEYLQTKFNIVSCYYCDNILTDLKSTTDRTPFHTKFVNERLREYEKNDVCKLKELCKDNGIYGANDDVNGFSGYICEVLIHKFSSYANVISAYGNMTDENKHELTTILDPVDERRILSSAISGKSFARFVEICRKKLGYPGIKEFYWEHDFVKGFLLGRTILVPFGTDIKPVIMRKLREIKTVLEGSGFKVMYVFPFAKFGCLVMESMKIDMYYLRENIISVTSHDACKNIPQINTDNSVKFFLSNNMTYNSIQKRDHTNAIDLLCERGFKAISLDSLDEPALSELTQAFVWD